SSGLAAGAALTVVINNVTYGATVLADGTWSLGVPAADVGNWPAGTVNITVSGATSAGNPVTITHPVTVDLAAVAISINTVSGDDVINAAEKGADLTLSGSTSGVEPGQTVTVIFGGKTYTATVAGDGSWTTSIPAADLAALRDGDATVQASVSTINGNTASATHAYSVDATAPTLTINTIATDDVINATEKGADLQITGTSNQPAGTTITVTLNGQNYTTTTDASGNWSVGVPAADVTALSTGSQTITASLIDRAGNSDSTTHDVTVDLSGPTLSINTVSGDDIINNSEKTQDLTISGGSSGLATGTTVTVMLNGLAYSATTDGTGNWSVTVPASAVGALGEAVYQISASATDSAGNSNSASHNVQVNTALPGVIINPVASDDIINAAESGVAQTISGQVTGAAAGDTVTVTLGGKTYTATVQGNLSWSVSVPAADIQAIGNGSLTVNASVTNVVGNTGNGSRDITIDANLPG
ncbi:Ig-like domain-containing protein, partial [Phocaeicola vulgatus]